jgi:uncharacterized protein YoxC
MEGGSLFNSGFLGASFNWWVGQIAADSTWRDNILPGKFDDANQIPGWGRRYKVRIIGLHDQGETEIASDQLPWAQVMYPVTAGGGQGSSSQTPNLRQGNMVFGFFLDGQEQQVPVIMGVLGNNAQTTLATKTGDNRVTNTQSGSIAVSGHAEPDSKLGTKDPNIKVPDDDLNIKKPGKNRNPDNAAIEPAEPGATKESADAVHQQSSADVKRLEVDLRKTVLLSPCDLPGSVMKGMQIEIENLTKDIDKVLQTKNAYVDAISKVTSKIDDLRRQATDVAGQVSGIAGSIGGIGDLAANVGGIGDLANIAGQVDDSQEKIQHLMEQYAPVLAKHMKVVTNKIGEYASKKINEAIGPLADTMFPNQRFQFLDMKIEVNEKLKCLFSKITDGLSSQILDALKKGLDKKTPSAGKKPADWNILPTGSTAKEEYSNTTVYVPGDAVRFGGDIYVKITTGPAGVAPTLPGNASTSAAVRATAPVASVFPGTAPVVSICSVEKLTGDIIATNMKDIDTTVKEVTKSIESFLNDIQGGLFAAGQVDGAVGKAGQIGVGIGKVTDIAGKVTDIAGQVGGISGQVSGLLGGLGGLGGIKIPDIGGNIASALSFENITLNIFECDVKPNCPASDFYTLQEGGGAAESVNTPRPAEVGEKSAAGEILEQVPTKPFAPAVRNPITDADLQASTAAERELIDKNRDSSFTRY